MKFSYLFFAVMLLSCKGSPQVLEEIVKTGYKEISGIEYIQSTKTLWAIEDSGNKNVVYGFTDGGDKKSEIEIKGIENVDWEDLASDAEGNLYIGDFGNNGNDREDLAIYKIEKNALSGKTANASRISFYYPEQKAFPPKKSERFFDVEAFIERNGSFYLFTKNRSAKFNGSFYIYKVPNAEGVHAAQLVAKLKSCDVYDKCAIAGAAISPDGKTIALIAADKLWLLTGFENDNFSQQNMQAYPLGHFSQKEGISFKDDVTLFIADEKNKKTGGYFYKLDINDLKTKS